MYNNHRRSIRKIDTILFEWDVGIKSSRADLGLLNPYGYDHDQC